MSRDQARDLSAVSPLVPRVGWVGSFEAARAPRWLTRRARKWEPGRRRMPCLRAPQLWELAWNRASHYSSILSVRTRAVVIINASSAIARSRTQTTSGLRAVRTAAVVSEQTGRGLVGERTRVAWPRIGALTERSTTRLRRRATPAVAASRARVELIAHAPCELGEWGCHRLEGWTSASSNEPSGPTMWKRSE